MQQDTGLLFLMCVLLFLSFSIAGSEVAFFSLSYKDIQVLKTKQYKPLKRIVTLLEQPKKLLTSMLIANSFINICVILVANILIDHAFIFDQIPIPGFEFIVKVIAVTLMLLFFGEIMPKVMATQNNIRFAQDFGLVIQLVYFLFARPSAWMVKYTNIIENKLEKRVHFLKGLTSTDLAIIYQLATVFVYPSLFEGFGIPIIEALYSKIPVITTENGVFPEAAGPNSLFIEPFDVKDLSDKIALVLQDSSLASKMKEEGWQFVQQFNDEEIAKNIMDCYLQVLST